MGRYLSASLSMLSVALIGTVVSVTPLGLNLEQNYGLLWLFQMRGAIPAPPEVVVVAISDQTGVQLGQSTLPRNWPRSMHGRLVETLMRHGVSTIIFDFDFQTPKQMDDDLAFARAIEASGRVILTERLVGKRQPLFSADGKMKKGLWLEQLVLPIPVLADAAKGSGTFPLPKIDVAVHQFWTFKHSVEYAPTIPAVALQLYAQDAYPELLALLKKAGVESASGLPNSLEQSDRAAELRKLMLALRRVFVENPQLPTKIMALIRENDKHESVLTNKVMLEALIGLYSGRDNRFLNFYGPPGTIATIPYHVVLGEEPDNRSQLPDLKGKVAFVGYSDIYDPGQPDRFYTVFTKSDGVDLSGVEIAATAFGNLLTSQSLAPLNNSTLVALVVAFGVIVTGLTLFFPAMVAVPLCMTAAAGYLYLAASAFAQNTLWLPLAVPLLVQLPMALFGGLLAQYLSERRKKKRATRAISYYLPEQLAKELTEKNLESNALGKVTYSICFASDMAGFTTISEQLRPNELSAFLNDYFETLSFSLRSHGVEVIEFRADGIMCAWTAEKNQAAIRRQAILAALDAVEAISHFRQRHPLLNQSLRVGLEAGMVYVGHSGGGGHYVYSIVGDCANTAARIEGLNKKMGTQILAGREVVQEVEGVLVRNLGNFQFVGKTEGLPIVEIVATKQTASEDQVTLCRRFEEAMTVFSNGCYLEAAAKFDALLLDYPEDGPSHFLSEYCKSPAVNAVASEGLAVIRLESK